MLSLKEFRSRLNENDLVDVNSIGKLYGGWDVTHSTSVAQNPHSSTKCDRKHYDYCYQNGNQYEDYRGGNYTLECEQPTD